MHWFNCSLTAYFQLMYECSVKEYITRMQCKHSHSLLLQGFINQLNRAPIQSYNFVAIANSPLIIIRTAPLNVTQLFIGSQTTF